MRASQAVPRTYGIVLCVTLMLTGTHAFAQSQIKPFAHCWFIADDEIRVTTDIPGGLTEANVIETHYAARTTGGWSNWRGSGYVPTHEFAARPGFGAQARVRYRVHDESVDRWDPWSDIVHCTNELTQVPPDTVDHHFMLQVGDRQIPLVNAMLGPFPSELMNATWEEFAQHTMDDLPPSCPDGSTWRVVMVWVQGDPDLEELFQPTQEGPFDDTGDNVALSYLTEEDGETETRPIYSFGRPVVWRSTRFLGDGLVRPDGFVLAGCDYVSGP